MLGFFVRLKLSSRIRVISRYYVRIDFRIDSQNEVVEIPLSRNCRPIRLGGELKGVQNDFWQNFKPKFLSGFRNEGNDWQILNFL